MSVVFVVVPMVIAGWPAIAAAVGAACAGLGYTMAKSAEEVNERIHESLKQTTPHHEVIEMEMSNAEVIGDSMVRGQVIQYEKDGVVATFSKDARGHLALHVGGERSSDELASIGQQLLNRVRQQFACEKIKQELSDRGFVMVEEHVDEEDNIRISVRQFR